jgi:prevent-host-death family protein
MAQAKSNLADLVGRVRYRGERVVLERWGQPVAVLISVEEYQRWQELEQATREQPLPPDLRQRQERLVGQARRLRAQLGDPVEGLSQLLSTLPPAGDEFWLHLVEEMP